jgi:acetyl-CoA acetyltransferase
VNDIDSSKEGVFSKLKSRNAIVGVGYTEQGKIPGRTAISFHTEAISNAIADAGITKDKIDALLLYRHFEPIEGDYDVTAFRVAEQLGIKPAVLSQEKYCTRTWLVYALSLLESGFCKYVAVSYGDNARTGRRSFVNELDHGEATDELAAYGDLSTMSKYAMLARRAMHLWDTGPHVWKEIAIAQRQWANLNPAANMYKKILRDEEYNNSNYIVEPFRMLDATPITDGGRAIILTTSKNARSLKKPYVNITGFGLANEPISPYRLRAEDMESAATRAAKAAFEMAQMKPSDIDACEIYDCFTYTVEATLKDYGFFRPGEEKSFLTREKLGVGGSFPVNTSGGMLSEGYFMGLTPISEGVLQLLGRCGKRQLGKTTGTKEPEVIMCSDNGGVFQSNCAVILTKGE